MRVSSFLNSSKILGNPNILKYLINEDACATLGAMIINGIIPRISKILFFKNFLFHHLFGIYGQKHRIELKQIIKSK